MLIIGIDPGISGSICFFQDGVIQDVVEMPTMIEGKKNKKQVNGSQIFNEISDEEILELAIDAGADECISNINFHEIHCPVSEIYNVKKNLENTIANFISTEIEWIPLNSVNILNEKKDEVIEFLDSLEEDEDVQNVFSNVNLEVN